MFAGRLIVVTDREQTRGDLIEVVRAAIVGGATAVLLREKDLPRSERAKLAGAILKLLDGVRGGQLLVASDVGLAVEVGAAGVHLAASDPWPAGELVGSHGQRLLVGRSCHSEREVMAAREEGADYVTVSPVFPTTSKPGYGPALGVEGLARLCQVAPELPVLALGGMSPDRVAPCLAAGVAGVAVMGEVMRAVDPASAVSSLRRELARER